MQAWIAPDGQILCGPSCYIAPLLLEHMSPSTCIGSLLLLSYPLVDGTSLISALPKRLLCLLWGGGIPLPPDHVPTWPMHPPPPSPVAYQWRHSLSLCHHHGNPFHISVLPLEYLGDSIDSPFGMEEVALVAVW
jgi:hypothetical protein